MLCELPVPVQVDAEGRWSVDGQPMILVPRHFWAYLQMEGEKALGVEAYARSIYPATYRAAQVWCGREAKTHGLNGADVFRHYLKRISQRGYGQASFLALDPAAGTGLARLDNSAFVAEYGKQAGRPVCHMFAGSFAGAMDWLCESEGNPHRAQVAETQCGAQGHDHCLFKIAPKG